MDPECKRVDGALIPDLARRLEEGGRVRGREATRAHEVDTRRFGLGLAGELQEDAGVIAGGRNGVQGGVVDLQDQVLDISIVAEPAKM